MSEAAPIDIDSESNVVDQKGLRKRKKAEKVSLPRSRSNTTPATPPAETVTDPVVGEGNVMKRASAVADLEDPWISMGFD